jgi:hypothetical protein
MIFQTSLPEIILTLSRRLPNAAFAEAAWGWATISRQNSTKQDSTRQKSTNAMFILGECHEP